MIYSLSIASINVSSVSAHSGSVVLAFSNFFSNTFINSRLAISFIWLYASLSAPSKKYKWLLSWSSSSIRSLAVLVVIFISFFKFAIQSVALFLLFLHLTTAWYFC